MRATSRVLSVFSFVVLSAALSAQTTWTGAVSTSWDNPFNWSTSLVPGPTTDVVIAPAVNQPSTYIFTPTCADLTIQSGASVSLAAGFDLDIKSDLLIQGTLAVVSGSSDLFVAGGFTNSGTFTSGGATVELTGPGVLAGTSATLFEDLVISGGVRSASVGFTVNGDATVTSTGKLDLAGGTIMVVRGNWTSSAAGASTTGAGTVQLEGTGSLTSGLNGLPNVSIVSGTRSINASKVNGDFTQSGGTVTLLDNATLLVLGDAALSGGTFGFASVFPGSETFDVNGDASFTCSAGAFSADVRILCAGNWTSNASFTPTAGSVELDGIGLRTLSGAGPGFFNLRIASGTVQLASPIAVGGTLLIDTGATLDADQVVDVAGSAVLGGATAVWDLGGLVHTVAANWTSAGGSATNGTVRFDGAGTVTAGTGAIANVVFDAPGVRNVGTLTITSGLQLSQGELRIADGATVSVGGDALLSGGILSFNDTTGANEILDVQGSISALGTTAGTHSAGSQVHCAGNWVSGGSYAPVQGTVRFDGGGAATLSGAAASFYRVRVVSGAKTFSSPVTIGADLQIDPGGTLISNALVDVTGFVTLGTAGSLWNQGGLTHRVGGNLSSTGGSTQNGMIALDGLGGTVSSGAGSFAAVRVVSGPRTFSSTSIAGNLELTGGTATLNAAAVVSVGGSASLTGGTLNLGGTSRIDVAQNVTFGGTTAGSVAGSSRIEFDGTFTGAASWAPASGLTAYTGGPAGVITGTSTLFSLAVESGALTVTGALTVNGNLILAAPFTTNAPLSIGGDVFLGATVDWNLGGLTHSVAGDWTSQGADALNGTIVFTGDGNLVLGSGTIQNVIVSGGLRAAFNGTLTGDLGVTGGSLRISQDQTLVVQGNAGLTGGLVGWFPVAGGPDEVLQVQGNVICNAGIEFESPAARFVCRGNWSSAATFAPAALRVVLDGAAPTTIGGAPRFHNLLVQTATRSLLAGTLVTGLLEISSAGALNASGGLLDVDGSVTVAAGSTVNLGALNHTVAGNWSASGAAVTGTGTLEFNGNGTLNTGVSGSISNALVSAGVRKVQTSVIGGTLSLTGGTLELQNDQVLTVNGAAQLTGGVLAFVDTGGLLETLDAKDVVLSAAAGTMSGNSLILCSGNWSSTNAWSPTAGGVVFDGGTSATIGGASPTFNDFVVLNGSKTVTSPAVVGGNVTVFGGHTLTTSAALTVHGNVVLLSGATWNAGALTHVIHKDLTTTGATVANSAVLELAGDGVLTTGASTIPTVRVTGGTRSVNSSIVRFNLEQTGGTLLIRDNQTLTVQDDLQLTAGSLGFQSLTPGAETLLVEGNVLGLSATSGLTSADSLIEARGNWTSSSTWAPASGLVRLAPAGAASLSGAAPAFARLQVASGTVTATVGLSVNDLLEVSTGAILVTQAAVDVNGDVLLGGATAAWDVGSVLHSIAGDWTSSGASATGAGFIAFDGPGSLATGGGSLPNVRVVAGLRTCQSSNVAGNLEVVGGVLGIADDAVFHVVGNASLTGGSLAFASGLPGPDVLDVDGNFLAAGSTAGATSASSLIRCAGNWNSSGAFQLAAGTVELDGIGNTTVSGAGLSLPKLRVTAGSKTFGGGGGVMQSLDLASGASIFTQGALDINGAVVLGNATATFNLGGLTHLVAGSWTSSGANAVNGTIEFDGTGTLDTGAATIANMRLSAGTRTARTSTIAGTVTQTAGALVIDADQTLTVGGSVALNAGSLGFFPTAAGAPEVLDIGGDAFVRAAAGTSSAGSVIRCAGDWSSNSAFDLQSGTIELDGAVPSTIGGLQPTFDPTFPLLVVKNGVRSAAADLKLVADQIVVQPGAELDVGAMGVDVPQGLATIDGKLSVGAGGSLALGPTAIVLVSATGTLEVRGTFADEAAVVASGAGGYLLAVDGTLDAENFRFAGMGASGITVTQLAVVTEMQGGVFSHPAGGPASILLDIRRPAPAVFSYVDFEDPLLVGGKNVRTLGGAPIDFTNSEGNLSGPAFEVDPLGIVDWIDVDSVVTSFEATGGADVVNLAWTTSTELDAEAWVIERSTSPGGPFGFVGEKPAVGPSSYSLADTAVVSKQHYFYRLMERKTHGELVEQDTSDATPWSTTLPANVLTVGPGGAFANIQTALAAATGPSAIISVAAGTYPPFTINGGVPGTLRIYGNGSGTVQIDTTAGPVTIQNVAAPNAVEISDLTIGSASSPNAGVVVQGCSGIIILDELVVHGGVAQPGIQASSSTKLAVQRCAVDGTPGMQASQGLVAMVGRGSLDELTLTGLSNVRVAQVNPTPTVDPGSTLTVLPGVHADLGAPEFISLGTTFTLTYSGELGGIYAVAYSASLAWFDLPSPFEGVGLLNLAQAPILVTGFLATPSVQQTLPVPPDGLLFGAALPAQMVVVNPITLQFRWSNVTTLVPLN